MTVTWWFTLSSGVALIVLVALTREFWLDRRALVEGNVDGAGLAMTTLLLVAVGGITFTDVMLFLTGMASLSGIRPLVFIIVFIPAVKLLLALWIYRLRGQARRALKLPEQGHTH